MTINERIKAYIQYKGTNARQLELLCGIGNGSVNALSDSSRETTFTKISTGCPDLNMEWLRYGTGEMIQEVPALLYTEQKEQKTASNEKSIDALTIALNEISAQRKLTEKSQEQIDRLLTIIESKK